MRLIDADKEIEKLEKKIESLKEELDFVIRNYPNKINKIIFIIINIL